MIVTAFALAAAAASTPPAPVNAWLRLPEAERHLLVMGTLDGMTASGQPEAPCFPGLNIGEIEDRIADSGHLSGEPDPLADRIMALAQPNCGAGLKRGYTARLVKSMSDEHLARYLTGLVAGYARLAGCNEGQRTPTAINAAVALLSADDNAQATDAVAATLAAGCKAAPSLGTDTNDKPLDQQK